MDRRVFISYSHRDIEAARTVERTLAAAGHSVFRDETRLKPGELWPREIAEHLAAGEVVVLLWSAAAAESVPVRHEWMTARALGKSILPCPLVLYSALSEMQRPPADLSNVQHVDLQPGSFEVGLRQLVEILALPDTLSHDWNYGATYAGFSIPFRPNRHFVGQKTLLLDLYLKLLGELNGAGLNRVVGLVGTGGIGKTQLAVEFAWRFAYAFPDGVQWIDAARNWQEGFADAARRLGLTVENPNSPDAEKRLLNSLQARLSERRSVLVIMDNVADPSDLTHELVPGFSPVALGCSLLFTTRDQNFPTGTERLAVDVLPAEDAFGLLTFDNPPKSKTEERAVNEICKELGYLPLAVAMAGAFLQEKEGRITYQRYLGNLSDRIATLDKYRPDRDLPTHEPFLLATFQESHDLLQDETSRRLFAIAGQMDEAEIIPRSRLEMLSGIHDAETGLDTPLSDAFDRLIRLCLVEGLPDEKLRLHPLLWEFSRTLLDENAASELRSCCAQRLADAYVDIEKLQRETGRHGVDSVVRDLEVLVRWSRHDALYWDSMERLRRLVDRERHVLRFSPEEANPAQQPAFVEQLLYRSHRLGFREFATSAAELLTRRQRPFLKPIGPGREEDLALVRTFTGHSGTVFGVDFSLDDACALSGSMDGTLNLWEIESGKLIRTFRGHSGLVSAVKFSPDGRTALSGSWDGTMRLWDIRTGATLRVFTIGERVRTLDFSADGRQALTNGPNGSVILWETASDKPLHILQGQAGWGNGVNAVSFSPDGQWGLCGSEDKTLALWDLNNRKLLRQFEGHQYRVNTVAFSPDGKFALSGANDQSMILWEVATGQPIRTFRGHEFPVKSVCFSPDGRRALSASDDDTIVLWELDSEKPLRTLRGHSWRVESVKFSPDGKRALSGSADNTLMLWDLQTPAPRAAAFAQLIVSSVCLSRHGRCALSGASKYGENLLLWDVRAAQPLCALQGQTGNIFAVSISPDGRHGLSGSNKGTLMLWDLESRVPLKEFKGHSGAIWAVDYSPDGTQVVSVSEDKTLIVWDVAAGKRLNKFTHATDLPRAVSFSPDGRFVATGSGAKGDNLGLWEVPTGKLARSFRGHSDHITAVRFSPDGACVASGSWDATVMLWKVATGELVHTFKGHRFSVKGIAFSSDGRHLLSGSFDETMRLWNIETGDPETRLIVVAPVYCLDWSANRIIIGDRAGQVSFFEANGI